MHVGSLQEALTFGTMMLLQLSQVRTLPSWLAGGGRAGQCRVLGLERPHLAGLGSKVKAELSSSFRGANLVHFPFLPHLWLTHAHSSCGNT